MLTFIALGFLIKHDFATIALKIRYNFMLYPLLSDKNYCDNDSPDAFLA